MPLAEGQLTFTPNIRIMPVDDLLYSQDSCSRCFHDGHQFEELISRLDSWELQPSEAEFMHLRVIEYCDRHDGRLLSHSLNNRRLYCLKQHQVHTRHLGWKVHAKVTATNVSGCRDMVTLIHRLLCFALAVLCCALLCLALLSFALLSFASLSFALLCLALLCSGCALLCFALLYLPLLSFALLCFA